METTPRYSSNIHIELYPPELTTESPKFLVTEIHMSTTVDQTLTFTIRPWVKG